MRKDPIVDEMRVFGVTGWAARSLVRQLRGPVTDTVCRLLPGVERATGMRWLFVSENLFTPMVVEMVGKLHPELPQERLTSAGFAVGLLYPITHELLRRHDAASPRPLAVCPPTESAPVPSAQLARLRVKAERMTADTLTRYLPHETWRQVRQVQARPVRAAFDDGRDFSWGAWTCFAASMALLLHNDDLPEPGRTADSRRPGPARTNAEQAGLAFELGRLLLVDFTLGLLDVTEGR